MSSAEIVDALEEIEVLHHHLQSNPMNAATWKQRGEVNMKLKRYFQALSDYEKSIHMLKCSNSKLVSSKNLFELHMASAGAAQCAQFSLVTIHHACEMLAMISRTGSIPRFMHVMVRLLYYDAVKERFGPLVDDDERYRIAAAMNVEQVEEPHRTIAKLMQSGVQIHFKGVEKKMKTLAELGLTTIDTNTFAGKSAAVFQQLNPGDYVAIGRMVRCYRCGPGGNRSPEVVMNAVERFMNGPLPSHSVLPILFAAPPGPKPPAVAFTSRDYVKIVACKEKGGFKMVATKAIKEGECFFCEEPIISVYPDYYKEGMKRCENCVMNHACPVKCAKCDAKYCSTTCRDKHYLKLHRALCGTTYREVEKFYLDDHGLEQVLHSKMATVMRLLAMSVAKKQTQDETAGAGKETPYENPLDMFPIAHLHRTIDSPTPFTTAEDHMDSGLQPIRHYYEMFHWAMKTHLPHIALEHPNCTSADLMQLCNVVTANAMSTGNNLISICFVISFVNHSCCSNATAFSEVDTFGDTIFLKALKNIAKGEEITISYVETNRTVQDRQVKFEEMYGFHCTCALCVEQEKALKKK